MSQRTTSDYFRKALSLPTLSREEERKLLLAYKLEGSMKARDQLVERYMKLVVSKAKDIKGKTNTSYGIDDLIMDGVEGLLIALTKFDISKISDLTGENIRLGTYARWYIQVWIVGKAMESKSSVYRLNCGRMRGVLLKANKLAVHYGFERPLSFKDAAFIANEIGGRVTASDVMAMDRLAGSEVSIDGPSREDGVSFGDRLSDGFTEDAMAEAIDGQTMKRELDDILGSLSEAERKIVLDRVIGDSPSPVSKLAEMLGLKRSAVKGIEETYKTGLIEELRLRLVTEKKPDR